MKTALAVLALASLGALAAEPLSADAVLKMVREYGPRGTLDRLWGTESWEQLTSGVASGAEGWIHVAKEIRRGTDAGSTSELMDAVAWALPKAPERVLSLLAQAPDTWRYVCDGPSVDEPPEGYVTYYRNAIAAVKAIDSAQLQTAKTVCLPLLIAAARRVRR